MIIRLRNTPEERDTPEERAEQIRRLSLLLEVVPVPGDADRVEVWL